MKDAKLKRVIEYRYHPQDYQLFDMYTGIIDFGLSPNNQLLVALSNLHNKYCNLHLWERDGDLLQSTIGLSEYSHNFEFITRFGVDFWPDNQNILISGDNPTAKNPCNNLKLWNISNRRFSFPLQNRFHYVFGFKVSYSKRYIYIDGRFEGGKHGTYLFDSFSDSIFELDIKFPGGSGGPGYSYVFSPDDKYIGIGGLHVNLFQIQNGEVKKNIELRDTARICAISPDEGIFITMPTNVAGECHSKFSICSSNTREHSIDIYLTNGIPPACTAEISPKGNVLATGHQDGSICIWDVSDDFRMIASSHNKHSDSVFKVIFSNNGNELFTADKYGIARWNIE